MILIPAVPIKELASSRPAAGTGARGKHARVLVTAPP